MNWQEKINPMVQRALPASQYEVMEIQPRRAEDKFYYLAGSEGMLAPMTSQFLALHEMINGPPLDLQDWIDRFELCFPDVENFSNTDFRDKIKPWGRPYEDRPRIFIRYSGNGLYLCEFFPDGNKHSDFSQILSGKATDIIDQAIRLIALARNLDYYDIGGILGYPVNEYFRLFPSEGITAVFRLKTKPDNYTDNVLYKTVTVRKININKLDYLKIWTACGGEDGLEFGQISANQKVGPAEITGANKGLSLIVAKGPTQEKAKKNVLSFLDFSLLKAKGLYYSEKDSVDDEQEQSNYKVFPCSVSFFTTKIEKNPSNKDIKGQETYAGIKSTKKSRILMRSQEKPPQFDSIINELKESMNN